MKTVLILLAMMISHSEASAQEERRLSISPGFTADRLVIKEPDGKVKYYVEKTLTGKTVIKDTGGRVVGRIDDSGKILTKEKRK